jgi:hypothetical protein
MSENTTTPEDNNLNVATDAWIPVVTVYGEYTKVSLIDIFTKEYKFFVGDVVEQYCLMRLCEAVAHSHLDNQPNNLDELMKIKDFFAEKTVEYLNANIDKFFFRGDNPFLQYTQKEIEIRAKELGKKFDQNNIRLREEYSTGNNYIQSSRQIVNYITVAEVVLDLLVQQVFGVTYGKTGATPSRAMMYKNSLHGNLNIFLKGGTILESIWLNMTYGCNFGRPVWETKDPVNIIGYLTRLIPFSVAINISDDLKNMYYYRGLEYVDMECDNSHIAYSKNANNEMRPRKVSDGFKFWPEFIEFSFKNGNRPCQLNDIRDRFEGVSDIDVIGIGNIFKASMGLYTTDIHISHKISIKNPRKLESIEYQEFLEYCYKIAVEAKGEVEKVTRIATKRIEDKKVDYNYSKYITSIFWNYLDSQSHQIFNAVGSEEDKRLWHCSIQNAINECTGTIRTEKGVLASYKFNEKIRKIFVDV